MEQLTHRSCSRCLYWSNIYREQSTPIKAICELKQNPEQPPLTANLTTGGNTCGQWKKLKWIYDPMFDVMKKDYK